MHRLALSRRQSMFSAACLCCLPLSGRRADAAGVALTSEVAPGVYVRRGVTEDASADNDDAIANITFIVGRNSVAVIDPGGSLDDGEGLRQAIRRVTDRPISHVVMTHVHPDHVLGAAAFVSDQPVFVGHAGLPTLIAARGEYYRAGLEKILGPGRAGTIIMPNYLVKDRAEIDLGERVLTLTAHGPAHTMSDLSVIDQNTGTLLTGDLLFVGRVPVLDGEITGWLAELAALKATMAAIGAKRAVPGHGPALVVWPDATAPLERYLHVLQSETRIAVANGVLIEDAATTVAHSERDQWQLFDNYNGRNVLETYRRLEWE